MVPNISHIWTKHSLDPFCSCYLSYQTTLVCIKIVFKVKQYVQQYGSPNTRLCAVTMEMVLYFIFSTYRFFLSLSMRSISLTRANGGSPFVHSVKCNSLYRASPPGFPPGSSSVSNSDFFSASSYLVPPLPITNPPSQINPLHYCKWHLYDEEIQPNQILP